MTEPMIIAILRGITPDEVEAVCAALIDNGIAAIEVPLNSPDALKSVALAAKVFGGRASIGAGTVLSVADVDAVAEAGAGFVVSPDCKPDVIRHTRGLGLRSYPGVMTPTEAFQAIDAGASGLKIFPAELVGPVGIRALKAVLPPAMPVLAVGGANPDNFASYIEAGCGGFGLGSYLYVPGRAADEVAVRARAVRDALAQDLRGVSSS